jgi:tol-pal system protein YbgF
LSEGRYKNGKKNGIWTIWFKGESQKKSKTNYKNGEKNGVEIEWGMGDDLYGYKIHQTNYKNGRKDGLYIKYFTNYDNNKEIKGYYQLGKKHGIWLEYHWDGELSRAQCYQNDEKTKLISCQNSELELEWQVEVTTQAGESKLKGEFKARQEAEARMAEAEARAQEAESLAQDAGKEAVLDDKENEKKAFQIYTDGRNDFIFGNYDKAIVLFKGYLDSFPNSKNVADAKLWLGRSYFVNELYSESKTIYLEFQSENPQHDKYPDSIYELSHVFFELGELDAAKKMLKKLIGKFPSHHLNKKAKQMLTKLENS